MIAEIITIGLEITTGSIINTNSKFIASKLLELGIDSYYHTTVDDNRDRLNDVFNIALKRADLIITTGGLGPTDDDLTKEVVAKSLNLKLLKNKHMAKNIKKIFDNLNKPMPSNNIKQSYIPEGAKFIYNAIGTAPGILINKDNKKIILLPGPPKEMKLMFNNEIVPIIHENYNIIKKSINIIGIGESELEMKIKDLINKYPDITIATFAQEEEIEIKIIGKGENKILIDNKIKEIMNIIHNRFHENIYGFDNIPIEFIVFQMLKEKNLKIGFCESCTGGLISSRFCRIPGVSSVFDRGIVTYSNKAKTEEVGVKTDTLEKYSAVSAKTALEMAQGLYELSGLDLTLSVTGIAGPNGSTKNNPVGTVYICIYSKDKNIVKKYNFNGNREKIQNRTASTAFFELRHFLLKL